MDEPTHVPFLHLITACSVLATVTWTACVPPEMDSLVEVAAPSPMYRFEIAKHIRGSSLWRAYLEHLSSESPGHAPVVSIDVEFQREITDEVQTGDYDDGVIYSTFELTELVTGRTLLTDNEQFEIPEYVIVAEDATRDEIQDEAFSVIEEKAVRYIRYSMDRALILEMGRAPRPVELFVAALEEVRDGHWSITLTREAERALTAIHASGRQSDE